MSGILYICATPIGNLEDITLRAIRILKEADLIAAEDTRVSKKLLNHFGIHTELTSYHEHNKWDKGRDLIRRLKEGKNIALVTDAGMPAVSDPGSELVGMCYDAGVEVRVIPGASASVSALVLSGLSSVYFCFEGFLPVRKKERQVRMEKLKKEERTMIIYEAPHRLKRTISELSEALGENRRAALVRELTKKHETVLRGTLGEIKKYYDTEEPKGECVLVVDGFTQKDGKAADIKEWETLSAKEHYDLYVSMGFDRRSAMRQVADDRGLTRRDIYKELV